jgi:thiol:disulfide interchange protein DsbD
LKAIGIYIHKTTPKGGPVPTEIKFKKNPLVSINGKIKEVGKLEKHHEPLFDVEVRQFSEKVDFIQILKLKGKAKTALMGTVMYMVCGQ